jgi:putative transposase
MLLYRGIVVSYEMIREWGIKLGQRYANRIKQRAPRQGDKWHLDEMCVVINKRKHWLWRAVDQDGHELDILLQSRRNQKAAKRFFRKLLKGLRYTPRVIVTDKLSSYGAAKKKILPRTEHR